MCLLAVKGGKKYYPQTLLGEYKYAVKEVKNLINGKLDLDESDDEYDKSDKADE